MTGSTITRTTAILTPVAAALWVLGIGLLSAGTAAGHAHAPLLAWGVVTTTTGMMLACVVATQSIVSQAVTSCADITTNAVRGDIDGAVTTTALKVGGAIATALSEEREPERTGDGSIRLYS